MMTYGLCLEHTRLAIAQTTSPYKGTMTWHWEVWDAIYGPGAGDPQRHLSAPAQK